MKIERNFKLVLALMSLVSWSARAANAPAPVQIRESAVIRGTINRWVSLPGSVAPNLQAALYSKVGGYLKAINVDKGDEVEKGALLAEIEAPELLADAARFRADVEISELDYKRAIEAQKKAPDLVTAQSIDAAKAKFAIAKANLEHAETLIGFCKITAPFSGTIVKRFVDPGAFVPAATSGTASQATPVVTLMDFRVVRVQVAVPEVETPRIKNDLPVKIVVEELAGPALNAKITRFAHALDDATRTMPVEIDVPNNEGRLRPGMYVISKIAVEEHANTLLVPIDAVLVEKTGASVSVARDGKVNKIPVKTGFNDGQMIEVLEGLSESQKVLLVGKTTLTNGQPVQVIESQK